MLINFKTFVFCHFLEYDKNFYNQLLALAKIDDKQKILDELRNYVNQSYEKIPIELKKSFIGEIVKISIDEIQLEHVANKILEVYFDE